MNEKWMDWGGEGRREEEMTVWKREKMLICECDVLTAGLYSLFFVLSPYKTKRLRVIPTRGDAYRRGYLLGKISVLLC